ncbi:hypothetical protein NDU88_000651 [Pleurodeles waltl]|uniref:Uncharacterized protein n=1 Tax=Pleurodeles waltl TaxID=8319 RepID=A0AAV7N8I4_PLEWA|nr:hypothetical protein NDU88_000651 [Pleurodeles waltl]
MKEAVARSGSSTVEIGSLSESVLRDTEEQEREKRAEEETRRETKDKKRNRQSTPKNQTPEKFISLGSELRKLQAQRKV